MLRVEIVANRSVQEDLTERMQKADVARHHTLFPEEQGIGTSGQRRGDHVWPEENFVLVAYVEEEEARRIKDVVEDLKRFFPDEWIRIFATQAVEL